VNFCEINEAETYKINVRATEILSDFACKKQIPFVFTSSDQVFDGKKGNYNEEDLTNPLNNYGKQKLLAEKLALKNKGIVCRMPLMIGDKGGYEKSLSQNLLAKKEQTLFTDEWRSVLHAELAAKALIKTIKWETGIYHLGGSKRINRYDLGLEIAKKIEGFDFSLVKQGKQTDVSFTAKRPADVSLNSEKALSLGFDN
jgi:dTDP-4-dehydrorhamnose reductase